MSEIVLECKACGELFPHQNNKRWYCSDCKAHVRRLTAKDSARRMRAGRKLVGDVRG